MLTPEQTAELKASAERLAAGRRLPRRRHRRVPLPPRREAVRLPRGQHPAAGRAPDHRDHHRHRPGQGCSCTSRPAAGWRAPQPAEVGHAVEARLNAEDPDRDFAPVARPHRAAGAARRPRHPGRHRRQRGRHHPGRLRLDDREDHRLRPRPRRGAGPAAPRDGRDHRDHRGRRHQQELRARPARPARGDRRAAPTPAGSTGSAPRAAWSATGTPAIALAAAAIEAYQDEEEVSRQRLLSTAHGGRPQVQHETGRPLDLKLRGVGYRVSVARIGPAPLPRRHLRRRRRAPAPTSRSSGSTSTAAGSWSTATASGWSPATHGPIHLVEVDGVTHRVSRDEGGVVRSPAPALVVATPLSVGDEVEAGAPILVLESMKMETVLRAPFRARVRECPVSVGSQVETGAPLMRLEPLGRRRRRGRTAAGAGRDRRDRPAARAGRRCPRPSGSRAACRTCAACCSASTSTRSDEQPRCCPATWPRGPSSAAGRCRRRAGPAARCSPTCPS